jgi:hypothetical protein
MNRQGDIFPAEVRNAVYLTEADRIQQEMYRIGRRTFERKVKLVSLLSDMVVIAPSHVLESPLTAQIFFETPELLTKGIFVPSLPTKFDSFAEFLREKRAEFSYSFDYSKKGLDKLADFLDEHSRFRIRRDVDAQRQDFTESLLQDLNNPDSRLSQNLRLSENERESLTSLINQAPLSRDILALVAEKLDQRRRLIFLEHIQALYYLMGSRWNNSDPLVHPRLISVYEDKFARAFGAYDPRLFSLVLKSLGLRQDLIDSLPLRDVIQLREEASVKNFRRKYFEIIDEARRGIISPSKADAFLQNESLEEIVLDLVDRKLAEEHRKISLHYKIKRIWSLTSFATTIISALASVVSVSPFTLGATIVSGTATAINTFTGLTDPLIDSLFRTKGTEFITFASQMITFEARRTKTPTTG